MNQPDSKRIITLALKALYQERRQIEEEIASLEREIGKRHKRPHEEMISKKKSWRISANGRKKISIAAKKRWAAYRATKGAKDSR